jgi:hypothetical protein
MAASPHKRAARLRGLAVIGLLPPLYFLTDAVIPKLSLFSRMSIPAGNITV